MADTPSSLHLFADVLARVHAVCRALAAEANWPDGIDFSRVVVEPPRDPSHGDMATNAAMVLAKEARAKPRDLAEQIVFDLFARYEQDPDDMPLEWREGTRETTGAARARRIGNFIAGMTDRFALTEHQRLFDSTPDLR